VAERTGPKGRRNPGIWGWIRPGRLRANRLGRRIVVRIKDLVRYRRSGYESSDPIRLFGVEEMETENV